MVLDIQQCIHLAWIALTIYWCLTALFAKRAVRTQALSSRLLHLLLLMPAFALLFAPWLGIGPLAWEFLPASPWVSGAGLVLTLLGLCFAIWARALLGRNWSGFVTVKRDHQLVHGGPYAFVRHPIYFGLLVAMLGTAIALGEVRGLIAILVAFVAWWQKSHVEDEFLMDRFGNEFADYKRRVKGLIPFVI